MAARGSWRNRQGVGGAAMAAASAIALVLTAGWSARPLAAQDARAPVRVRVVDAISERPVVGAGVQLVDEAGEALEGASTDAEGRATLPRRSGAVGVRVRALGYREALWPLPAAGAEEEAGEMRLGLDPSAFELDSLTVEARAGRHLPGRLQFTRRREGGRGLFLDPVDVQLKARHEPTDVFRDLEGVRRGNYAEGVPEIISGLGQGCFMYVLNNVPLHLDPFGHPWAEWPLSSLRPRHLMAVEVYRHFEEVPEEMRHLADFDGEGGRLVLCGLVVIWTQEGWW